MTDLQALSDAARCTHVVKAGAFGPTMDDETESVVCLRPATKIISRPDVRPKYRCDEHAAPFAALGFSDMTIEEVQP